MDPVANMLTALVNAQRVRKARVAVPYSSFKERLVKLFLEKDLVVKYKVQSGTKPKLVITLAYEGKEPKIKEIHRISRPGRRQFVMHKELPYTGHRPGIYVISTAQGLKDQNEARAAGLGGELVCELWQV